MRQRIYRGIFFLAIVVLFGLNLALAQGGVQATFMPTISQKVDARTVPAKVTGETENALTSNGYVQIGTINASVNGKMAEIRITQQLQSAILQKAALAGGDVVHFSKEGSFQETDVPTGKSRKIRGECIRDGLQAVATPTTTRSCTTDIHGFTNCSTTTTINSTLGVKCVYAEATYVPITRKEESLVSEGTVWRFDPMLAEDIARAGTFIPLSSILGKDINSAEMRAWLSNLGTPEKFGNDDRYYYDYKSKGIRLVFTRTRRLNIISLYSEGVDGYRQYKGNLPYGLSFQSSRKEIESILGTPNMSSEGVSGYQTSYHSKGIDISYNTKRSHDMNARMKIISIQTVP